jgi:hypothetical protein
MLGATGILFGTSAVAGASGSSSPPASQTPTTCSTSSSVAVQSSGTPTTVTLGETCAFADNSTVALSYEGTPLPSVTAGSTGLISVTASAEDPSLSFNGGTYYPASYSSVNTLTATGTNSAGGSNTATFLITLSPPASTSASTTSGSGGGLAFTGADLAALIAGGLALLLLGTGVVLYTRRQSEDAEAA